MITQETQNGKNKPSSIATSVSKHDINLLKVRLRRPLVNVLRKGVEFVYSNCKSLKNGPCIPFSIRCLDDKVSVTMSTAMQPVHSDVNVMNRDDQPKNLKVLELFRNTKISQKKSTKKHLISKRGKTVSSRLRRKNSQFVHLVMTSLTLWTLIGAISCTEINVTWSLKTNPAIIGSDVTLECVISDEDHYCNEYTKQWYGGVHYGLLCQDGMCRNNKKYTVLNISSCKHHLVIYNFTEQDLNQNYTCSYGIFNERKGLTLKDGPFELRPSKTSFHEILQMSDTNITVHLQMLKVYPMPSCTFKYKETNITKYVQASVEMVGSFFRVNFTLNYPINDQCKDDIMIACTIGTYKMNISENCQEGNRQLEFSNWITVGIVVGVACLIVSLVMLRLRRSDPDPVQV